MNRRSFIKKSFLGIVGITAMTGLYAWRIEPHWLEFVRVKMPIKNLPESLVGKILMQISDIHTGNRVDNSYLINSLKRAKEYNPDFVVYTGDYVTLHQEQVMYDKLEEVFQQSVQGRFGTVAIFGNHDYGFEWSEPEVADQITKIIEKEGITVLKNSSVEIEELNFIGLDDYWAKQTDAEKAFANYEPTKANIVLCHNPDVCDLDVWHNYKGWILSGHTHGGQCKPPFLPPPILPVKNKNYTAGKFNLSDGRTLYINRGLGHSQKIRLNVRPEITIFELEKV
ncbi:metallophosphoesterase [Capnocytophaga cynodegmi]|uniref:metallophosphoesterase n=1 Tax=Capnocytophaga cynodegmi TaxID=28189 RepID=UPI001EE39D6E|nr:metallophosphoesterase [Capnocytophaga cynodegmi]